MHKILLLPFFALSCQVLSAQSPALQQKAQDAYTLSRMAEKLHVQPRPLDDVMSDAIYSKMLEELDDQHIFFTAEDIRKLSAFRFKLDEDILHVQTNFLTTFTGILQQRLQQVDTMIDHVVAKPFNYSIREKLTAAEDSSYPSDLAAMHIKIYKLLKLSVGNKIALYSIEAGKPVSARTRDSLEQAYRKKAGRVVKRGIQRILKGPAGFDNTIGTIYCQTLSACYDPHTNYFTADEKTAFESMLGNKALSFGLSLSEDEDGNPQIGHLQPGGPAFQSGALHEGDKILSVQWESQQPIDLTGAGIEEVSSILAQEGGDKITLQIKRVDGTSQQVVLHKEKISTDDEDDKVKGFLLKGDKTVGYISLPAFYEDWESNKGLNGCANDVAKEIIKLKKENISGLILDLRYNGGGSIQEAVELSGIFIDAGPVAQIKSREAKPVVLKDINRGTIYDGPLLLLVNGSSASASEMVAGTLQDYNRALIVGSPTYGKATAQVIFPLDSSIDLETYKPGQEAASYVKMTISKLYRINGSTAQFSGVKPDILLPDPAEALQQRESDEKFALPPTPIEANKYYKPLAPLPVAALVPIAQKAMDADPFFKAVRGHTTPKDSKKTRDYSLLMEDIMQVMQKRVEDKEDKTKTDSTEKNNLFEVANHAYEAHRIQSDHDLQESNEERKKNVRFDPYVKISYQLIGAMIK